MNTSNFLLLLSSDLKDIYDPSEISATGRVVIDHLQRKSAAPISAEEEWSDATAALAESIRIELKHGKPLQYVLKEAWFDNRLFYVDPSVLIPRPETEELFDWIKKDQNEHTSINKILEVGTGSGILSISLKKAYPLAEVIALDISAAALEVAQKNSNRLGESVVFKKMDFTNESLWIDLPSVDILVSNPPYISEEERPLIPSNVIDHEPALALFVPSNDPLQFYRSIGLFGRDKLNPGGRIYVEIHESRGMETANLFESLGYSVVIRTDMQGKQRMILAMRKD